MSVHSLILKVFAIFLAILGAKLAFGAEQEPRKVIASIKPLGLITEEILNESGIGVEVLLPPTSSPHNYALRISDVRRLQMADLVIWLGEDAEPYINPGKTKSHLALLSHIKNDQLMKEEDHDHSVDPHIWLDPVLAQEIAGLIAGRLMALYPDQKTLIAKNIDLFSHKNIEVGQKLNRLFKPYQGKGFLTYHNAYGYFVRRYGLRQLGVIQPQVGGGMSVKHLVELRRITKPGESVCLFKEPQFIQASIPDLGEGRNTPMGILDPLGIEAESYHEILETLANQLVRCFGENNTN